MGTGADPDEIEAFLRLAQSGSFGARVVAALMRRIVELQETASEPELLAMVAQVEALLSGLSQ